MYNLYLSTISPNSLKTYNLTIKKLTDGNPTMKVRLDSLSNKSK